MNTGKNPQLMKTFTDAITNSMPEQALERLGKLDSQTAEGLGTYGAVRAMNMLMAAQAGSSAEIQAKLTLECLQALQDIFITKMKQTVAALNA